jgi:hypothetical protein
VASSWPMFVSQCKSRLSAIARSCFLGRAHWHQKFTETHELVEELLEKIAESEAIREEVEQENGQLRERIAQVQAELAAPRPMRLPLGDRPPGQQYGAGMITLCVNLARKIGLRRTETVLHVLFDWMRIDEPIPTHGSIRIWMQRIGLDRMQSAKQTGGGVWLVDHTNQIGREKVLTVLRVPKSRLPRRGVPLRHRDIEVLALLPGEQWKRQDVSKVYQETMTSYGMPRAIESDGAVELREPAETLRKNREKPLVLRDPKHFLANKFEALLNQDPQYAAFVKQLGGTRSALQQTELAHFIPPAFKLKARFMNLAPTLTWASTVLWHLDHPESQSREGLTEGRMREKLGWLRKFASSIERWEACQQVVSTALTCINKQGLFRGAAKQLKHLLASQKHNPMSLQLVNTVLKFLRTYERKLRSNERLPMSTEILESSFSLYKQLENQHSKSGFTGLLLTFPTLLRKTTTSEVIASFKRVKVADVHQWVKTHLPSTLASKRQLLYREARTKTKNRATPLAAAA